MIFHARKSSALLKLSRPSRFNCEWGLIQAQYGRLSDAVSMLRDAFQDKPCVADALKRIQAIEAQARRVSREITRQLSLTMIRPFGRDDIHDLNQPWSVRSPR